MNWDAPAFFAMVAVVAVAIAAAYALTPHACAGSVVFISGGQDRYTCENGATATVESVDGKQAVVCRCGGAP